MDTTMHVSVVVATRNRQHLLAQTLAALRTQTIDRTRFDIVIADNGSTDETAAVVAAAAGGVDAPAITYLRVERPGKSFAVNRALNLLLQKAPVSPSAHVIAFTDDDVQPEPHWLARLCETLDETGADFVAGRIYPVWESPPPRWMSRALYGVLGIPDGGATRMAITPDEYRIVPIGANMAVRASVIAQIGGLRTDLGKLEGTLRTGEDHEFFLRMLSAGYCGVYEPGAVVRHWVPTERLTRSYCRRWLYQNGRDVARLEGPHARTTRVLRVPRYLWREAAQHTMRLLAASATNDAAARFAAGSRLLWICGYVRERWRGAAAAGEETVSGRPSHAEPYELRAGSSSS